MMSSTLQSSPSGRQNFLAKRLGHALVDDSSLYCIEQRLSLHSGPPIQHEHSFPSEKV